MLSLFAFWIHGGLWYVVRWMRYPVLSVLAAYLLFDYTSYFKSRFTTLKSDGFQMFTRLHVIILS